MSIKDFMKCIHSNPLHGTRADGKVMICAGHEYAECGKFRYYYNSHKREWIKD